MVRGPDSRAACLVALAAAVFAATIHGEQGDAFLRINFVDVGQGDAVWIQGPRTDTGEPGGNVIIDGGPDRSPRNRLIAYLQKPTYGLQPDSIIDCIVATHPHDDHYPGLVDVLATYQVRLVVDSGFPKEGPKFKTFMAAATAETAGGQPSRVLRLRDTTERTIGCGNLQLSVLHADSSSLQNMGKENTRENNASTVVKLAFGAFTFLFMGDAEGKERADAPNTAQFVEELLLKRAAGSPGFLRATVLKVGHHGSETGSTLPFIRAVAPEVLVIMSGRRSFSGRFLPDSSVIDRYKRERSGITVVRTDYRDASEHRDTTNDEDGDDVYMYTDGDSLRVYQSRGPVGNKRWRLVRSLTGS
jgi:competence protein ComEC